MTREEVYFDDLVARLEAQQQAEQDRIEEMLAEKEQNKRLRDAILCER